MTHLDKSNFEDFYNAILKSYSEDFKNKHKNDYLKNLIFFEKDRVEINDLENLLKSINNNELESILQRIIGVYIIIDARENNLKLDIKKAWKFISESILKIELENTISSIGSQGFLSIPLYKYDPNLENFDFIRLHIWDTSLNELMDTEKCELFGIHTHTFHAKSWIIAGELVNERFDHVMNSDNAEHSIFEVVYNDSLNNVNQHSSTAINKHINVEIIEKSRELYKSGDSYEIKAGKFHRSNFINQKMAAATFFSFTGKDGLDKSIVVGPKSVEESEVNRKAIVNPTELINKITNQLSTYEN